MNITDQIRFLESVRAGIEAAIKNGSVLATDEMLLKIDNEIEELKLSKDVMTKRHDVLKKL